MGGLPLMTVPSPRQGWRTIDQLHRLFGEIRSKNMVAGLAAKGFREDEGGNFSATARGTSIRAAKIEWGGRWGGIRWLGHIRSWAIAF